MSPSLNLTHPNNTHFLFRFSSLDPRTILGATVSTNGLNPWGEYEPTGEPHPHLISPDPCDVDALLQSSPVPSRGGASNGRSSQSPSLGSELALVSLLTRACGFQQQRAVPTDNVQTAAS